MNIGDKIAIIEGKHMGGFGYIKDKVNWNTFAIKLDGADEVINVQGYEIEPFDEEF